MGIEKDLEIRRAVKEIDHYCGQLLVASMGKTAWEYDDLTVEDIYGHLNRDGRNFERLVQLLNRHHQKNVEIKVRDETSRRYSPSIPTDNEITRAFNSR